MYDDRVISVLLGLAGACGSNPKTDSTDDLVIKALASGGAGAEDMTARLRAEKHRIAPNCADCQNPCGNTSDYDMKRLYNAEKGVREAKIAIIETLCKAAAAAEDCHPFDEDDMATVYRALSYVSYNLDEETLLSLLAKVQRLKTKAEVLKNGQTYNKNQ